MLAFVQISHRKSMPVYPNVRMTEELKLLSFMRARSEKNVKPSVKTTDISSHWDYRGLKIDLIDIIFHMIDWSAVV